MNNFRNTVKQLQPALGDTVGVSFEKLTIACRVLDAKNSYGQVRLLVAPLAGDGEQWIELGRLRAIAVATTSFAALEVR